MPGTTTLAAEVTNVSSHCIWLLVDDEELALPYSEFPWFKAATIQQIINVLRPSAEHLYWPGPVATVPTVVPMPPSFADLQH
jgi:hypothetical protein